MTFLRVFLILFLACQGFAEEERPVQEQKPAEGQKPAEEQKAPPEKKPVTSSYQFAWPFLEREKMQPRGGMTKGSEVTLAKGFSERWTALQEEDLSQKEKDRRAILALEGSYRVSFDFLEIQGFTENYQPPPPYFSWGTEHVTILAEEENFISLQHALVMYMKDKEGKEIGPFVMKHWRQDWTYEDPSILEFQGELTWEKKPAPAPAGRWSQAVFQVDDSPRYEVVGKWSHEGAASIWTSDSAPRPLPRREFSVRDDYQILRGTHKITIAPQGWTHLQNNEKVTLKGDVIAQELGFSRYERITEPELTTAFAEYWEKTAPYWAQVRAVWRTVSQGNEKFSLSSEMDGKKLWQHHFEEAGQIEKGEDPTPNHAADTITSFLRDSPPKSTSY